LPVVLNKSLKAALVVAKGQAGFIHLRDKTGKTMRLITRRKIPDAVAERITTISSSDGLVAWVARNKETLLIPDITDDPRTVYLVANGDFKVYVGVPISRGQRVWGTLSIVGDDPSQFGDDEVNLLASVGEEIGLVVENARLRRQTERLLVVQERNRLARELHDSVTQSLYSVTLFAEAGRRTALAAANEETAEYFAQIGKTGQQALKEMRLLVYELRPLALRGIGLVGALQQRLDAVERRSGVEVQLSVEEHLELPRNIEEELFRIAMEALNNALKHANHTSVTVTLRKEEKRKAPCIELAVIDDGLGFIPGNADSEEGFGLVSMRERIEKLGGELDIISAPGEGTQVIACLNLESSINPDAQEE
jgi:signal transduction histidine kinase